MRRLQFSLRTMLAVVAIVGIGAALWIAEPSWQVGTIEALFLVWVPASAVVLAVNSAGKTKAWWIGNTAGLMTALFVYFEFWFPLLSNVPLHDGTELVVKDESLGPFGILAVTLSHRFRPLLQAWGLAPIVGLLCVATHLLFVGPPDAKD